LIDYITYQTRQIVQDAQENEVVADIKIMFVCVFVFCVRKSDIVNHDGSHRFTPRIVSL